MKYLPLFLIIFASCTKQRDTFTCQENYYYVGKSYLDFTRSQEYQVKNQNSPYLTKYNPATGVLTWVKRTGTHVGTNRAYLYNTDVNFKIICEY
jgi:hypothetical protein